MLPCGKCRGKAIPGTGYLIGIPVCEPCYDEQIAVVLAHDAAMESDRIRRELWDRWNWAPAVDQAVISG